VSDPSFVLARLRLRLHRGAVVYWSCVALIAAVAAVGVLTLLRHGAARNAAMGPTRRVVVATAAVQAGQPLAGHVEVQPRSRSMVPVHALRDLPAGRVATAYIAPGEVVVTERVSGSPGSGPAALLPHGTRGVAVAVDDTGPPLRVGDRVDLLASSGSNGGTASPLDASEADPAAPPNDDADATTIASGVPVVSTRSGAVTVAIPLGRVGVVAAALAHSSVSVVLAGGASGS